MPPLTRSLQRSVRVIGYALLALSQTGCGAVDALQQLWQISRDFPDVNLLILLDINEDEESVPEYQLPDLLQSVSGEVIDSPEKWENNRQALLSQFARHVYGITPLTSPPLTSQVLEHSDQALNGKALRKQVRLDIAGEQIQVLMYTPAHTSEPVPAFLILNFRGNHTISNDDAVLLPASWVPVDEEHGVMSSVATENNRGQRSRRYPVEKLIERGYGLVTAYYGDFYPDHREGHLQSVQRHFDSSDQDDRWGAIGVWAWGLSRILDYLEEDPQVDSSRVVAVGHSRLGKAALWAGAQDQRFAAVVSNNSGAMGAAISRRRFGETVELITAFYPHWFTESFLGYADQEDDLPVDQHQLIALIAPRPVYVASASKDLWADPRGEFLAASKATEVYRLYGLETGNFSEMPAAGASIAGHISYHLREGKHDLVSYDWAHFMDFADSL